MCENTDIVVKWNGVPINEAIEKVDLPISEGILENEKIQRTFYLSGNGKDSVEVTYIDSMNQLHGTWGGLAIIPEIDKFEIIND